MQPSLLHSLEVLAAAKGLRDPAVILAIDEDKRRRQRQRARPYWLRDVIDGDRQDGQ